MGSTATRFRGPEKPQALLEAVIVLLLLVSVGPPGCQKTPDRAGPVPEQANRTPQQANQMAEPKVSTPGGNRSLPRLVDLGAGKCIPCKKMAPILEELKREYAGVFAVEFIDVWQNPSAGRTYGIELIPTQIFYDESGKERFRHEGFFSKEEILATWKKLGVELRPGGQPVASRPE